eukprot:m.23961 g.23961  ORF g.23961 m.23961 type:complete len:422 (-) comp14430_c0_seq1:140-1405(-)
MALGFLVGLFAATATAILAIACLSTINIFTRIISSTILLWRRFMVSSKPGKNRGGNRKERVLLVTDTGPTNICGVLRKFHELQVHLKEQGCEVEVIHTGQFLAFPAPWFKEVELPIPTPYMLSQVALTIERFDPDHINIMTEGTLGLVTRCHCTLAGRKFTTMWCTRFDLYMEEVMSVLAGLARSFLKWFHGRSQRVITPSPSMGRELIHEKLVGPEKCRPIMNGCNTSAFTPNGPKCAEMKDMAKPIWLYVGRVSQEKNVLKFLELHDKLPGSLAVVGQGPFFDEAVNRFSSDKVKFLGWQSGEDLAATYRSADVFVFPSRTDTFGQVMVEAMASGLPVAAFPVTGPIDVVASDDVGCVDEDLYTACMTAYRNKDMVKCVKYAKTFSWSSMTSQFLEVQREAAGKSSRHRTLSARNKSLR